MSNLTTERLLQAYQRAINKIDDYFEYRHESEQDKIFITKTLDVLTNETMRIFRDERRRKNG